MVHIRVEGVALCPQPEYNTEETGCISSMTPHSYRELRSKKPFLLPPALTGEHAVALIKDKNREINSLHKWHDSGWLDDSERECIRDVIEIAVEEMLQVLTREMVRV